MERMKKCIEWWKVLLYGLCSKPIINVQSGWLILRHYSHEMSIGPIKGPAKTNQKVHIRNTFFHINLHRSLWKDIDSVILFRLLTAIYLQCQRKIIISRHTIPRNLNANIWIVWHNTSEFRSYWVVSWECERLEAPNCGKYRMTCHCACGLSRWNELNRRNCWLCCIQMITIKVNILFKGFREKVSYL